MCDVPEIQMFGIQSLQVEHTSGLDVLVLEICPDGAVGTGIQMD
jgi:hypothetical protein